MVFTLVAFEYEYEFVSRRIADNILAEVVGGGNVLIYTGDIIVPSEEELIANNITIICGKQVTLTREILQRCFLSWQMFLV